jgi:hypothetical protein
MLSRIPLGVCMLLLDRIVILQGDPCEIRVRLGYAAKYVDQLWPLHESELKAGVGEHVALLLQDLGTLIIESIGTVRIIIRDVDTILLLPDSLAESLWHIRQERRAHEAYAAIILSADECLDEIQPSGLAVFRLECRSRRCLVDVEFLEKVFESTREAA